jgi:nitrogen fixation protein FixH
MADAPKPGELRGVHVLGIFLGAFGVIIAVNLAFAWQAVSTFPGLETGNPYVASQTFDRDRAAQEALGWTVDTEYGDGRLALSFTDGEGRPAPVARLAVLVGRTTVARDDQRPEFTREGRWFEAPVTLAPGRWLIRIEAEATDGTRFAQRRAITVRGG